MAKMAAAVWFLCGSGTSASTDPGSFDVCVFFSFIEYVDRDVTNHRLQYAMTSGILSARISTRVGFSVEGSYRRKGSGIQWNRLQCRCYRKSISCCRFRYRFFRSMVVSHRSYTFRLLLCFAGHLHSWSEQSHTVLLSAPADHVLFVRDLSQLVMVMT